VKNKNSDLKEERLRWECMRRIEYFLKEQYSTNRTKALENCLPFVLRSLYNIMKDTLTRKVIFWKIF
jgi:hypothetical protein